MLKFQKYLLKPVTKLYLHPLPISSSHPQISLVLLSLPGTPSPIPPADSVQMHPSSSINIFLCVGFWFMQSLSTDVTADVEMAPYSHVGNIQHIFLLNLDAAVAHIKSDIFVGKLDQNVVFKAKICLKNWRQIYMCWNWNTSHGFISILGIN